MTTTITLPKGWIECPSEHLSAAKASGKASHANRYVDWRGRWVCDYEGVCEWEMVEYVAKVGEPKEGTSSGAATLIHQAGLHFAKHKVTGEVIARESPEYYSYWRPFPETKGHDICAYCGTDNGEHGEYRMGYDCCQCGGN